LIDALLLLGGLALLIKGAGLLVSGASSIAERLGVSPLVIGLTVVSFGTSLPEMLVTLVSGLRQNADLAIANIIGSNIANVLLVLGIAAVIRPLPVKDSTVVSEIPFSLTAALLVGFLANAALFSSHHELSISRLDGGILLFFFALFMLYVYKISREGTHLAGDTPRSLTTTRSVLYILLGVAGLYLGGGWAVRSSPSARPVPKSSLRPSPRTGIRPISRSATSSARIFSTSCGCLASLPAWSNSRSRS
jgi:cation:H+ antiporter